MNLHPGKMDTAVRSARMERKSTQSFSYAPFIFKSMLLFLAFMGVLVWHLYLRQQSVKAAERTEGLKEQIEKDPEQFTPLLVRELRILLEK